MSRSIDERVVEMRFDNDQFERGAAETMSTLQRLKNLIDKSTTGESFEGLEQAANGVNFAQLEENVQRLSDRFSTFGIVGMRIVENITDAILGPLGRALTFVSDSIISGGLRRAQNIENARFTMQALLNDEAQVNEVLSNAQHAVDGTAYAYDESAKAAAVMIASGVQAGEEMERVLGSIAGVAATTNSSFSDIADIFTVVAGRGAAMTDEFNRLNFRGLNAFAYVRNYVEDVRNGIREVSDEVRADIDNLYDTSIRRFGSFDEGTIRELASDRLVTSQLFFQAMSDQFADAAARANETFSGAFANWKSALARIGEDFFTPLIEQNSAVVRLLNSFRLLTNQVRNWTRSTEDSASMLARYGFISISERVTNSLLAMSSALADALNPEKWSYSQLYVWETGWVSFYNVIEGIVGILRTLGGYLVPIKDAFLDAFNASEIAYGWLQLTTKFREFATSLRPNVETMSNIYTIFSSIFSVVKTVVTLIGQVLRALSPILKPLGAIVHLIISVAAFIADIIGNIAEFIRTSPVIRAVFDAIYNAMNFVMTIAANVINGIAKIITKIRELGVVSAIFDALRTIVEALVNAVRPYLQPLIDKLRTIRDRLAELIPEKFQAAADWIEEHAPAFVERLRSLDVSALTEKFRGFIEKIIELKNRIKEFLENSPRFQAFIEHIKEFFQSIREGNFSFDNVINLFSGIGSTIGGVFGKFRDFIEFVRTRGSSGLEHLNGIAETVREKFGEIGEAIRGFFGRDFNFNTAITAFFGGASLGIMNKFVDALRNFSEIGPSISGALESVSGAIEAYQNKLKAESILKIAIAIGVLAAAVVAMSFVNPERLGPAVAAVAALGGVIAGVVAIIEVIKNKLSSASNVATPITNFWQAISKPLQIVAKGLKVKLIMSAIKDLATALLLTAISIIALGIYYTRNREGFTAGAIAAGVIAGVAVAIIAAIMFMSSRWAAGENAWKTFAAIAAMIVSVGITFRLIVSSVKALMRLEIPSDYSKKLEIFAAMIIGVMGLIVAIGLAARIGGGNSISAAGSLIASAILIFGIVTAIKKLFELDIPEDYEQRLGILTGIFVALVALIVAIGVASHLGKSSLGQALSILALAGVIVAITISLAVLSRIDMDKLLNAAVALGSVMLALAVAMAASSLISENSWKTTAALAAAVVAITLSLLILSFISWQKLVKACAALGSILVALALDLKAAAGMSDEHSLASVVAMIMAIVTITGSLLVLSQQPWENIIAAAVSLGIVMAALALVMLAIGNIGGETVNGSSIINQLVTLGLAIAAMYSVVGALIILSQYDMSNALTIAEAVGLLLVALIPMVVAMELIGSAGVGSIIAAATGIAAMEIVLWALVGTLAALGWIFDHPTAQRLVRGGLDFLNTLFTGLATIVGNAISAFGVAVTSGLPQMGENISGFFEALRSGLDALENIPHGVLENAGILVDTVKTIVAEEFIHAISSVLGGGNMMEDLSESLVEFAKGLVLFGDTISEGNLDPEKLESAAQAASYIGEACNYFRQGGLRGIISGNVDFSHLGENLANLATGIVEFAKETNSLDSAAISKIEQLAGAIQTLAAIRLGGEDAGFFTQLVAGRNLSNLPIQLGGLGHGIASFWEAINSKGMSSFDSAKATEIASVIQTLAAIRMGGEDAGFFDQLAGNLNFLNLSTNLGHLGQGVASLFESISKVSVDTAKANDIAGIIQILAAIKMGGEDAGFFDQLMGNIGFANLSSNLASLGGGIVAFYNSVSEIDISKLRQIVNVVKDIGALESIDGSGFITLTDAINVAANTGVGDFIEAFETADVSSAISGFIDRAVSALDGRNTEFQNEGMMMMKSLIHGIIISAPQISDAGKFAVDLFIRTLSLNDMEIFNAGCDVIISFAFGITDNIDAVIGAGYDMLKMTILGVEHNIKQIFDTGCLALLTFVDGIDKTLPYVIKAGQSVAASFLSGLNQMYGQIVQTGSQAGQGYINGVNQHINAALNAGRALGNATTAGSRQALNEKSPSKEMYEIGDYAGEGFVNALIDWIKPAENTGSQLGTGVLRTLGDAIQSAVWTVNSDMENFNPVITPLVDTSSAEASADLIAQMFNDAVSVNTVGAEITNGTMKNVQISDAPVQTEQPTGTTNNFQFIQNNTSPKALDRIEIYRQTRNQISLMKEVVNTV